MDYGRLKELAEAFVGRGCKEYPSELEALLRETAATGVIRMQWSVYCQVLHHRLEQEINSAFVCESELGEEDKELGEEVKEMKRQLLRQLDQFENAPFTVQRLCELILQPKKHYRKLDCYLRAVEKNLRVVGTQEPELDWMKNPRLTSEDKLTLNSIKENGMTDISEKEPHSPPAAPPPMDKDSPPTAPTSTWSNTREGAEEEGEGGEIGGRVVEGGRAPSPPPLCRKRSRDSLEEDEDKFPITVRQEADSTVNFEPPSFDPPPPLFQVIDETPTTKKPRECVSEVVEGRGREEVRSEGEGEKMTEGVLSSSTELMDTAATESSVAGNGEEGEETKRDQNSKTGETVVDRSGQDEATPGNQETKQALTTESLEPMITN